MGLVSTIFGVGYLVTNMGNQVPMKGFQGDPNLDDLLDHLSKTYPGFWKLVVTPLEGPMMEIYQASILFVLFCVLVLIYGCGVCLCHPYTDPKQKKDELSV